MSENQNDTSVVNTIVSGPVAAISPQMIVDAQIVDNIVIQYYTVIYTYDDSDAAWFATGILAPSAEEAMRQFQGWSNVKRFHIVRINLTTKAG